MELTTDLLSKIYLFEGVSENHLEALCSLAKVKELIAGDPVFSEKSPASSLYFIANGSVEICKRGSQDEQKVAILGRGSVVGELAFVDPAPRTASAEAKENSVLIEFQYSELTQYIHKNPDFGLEFYKAMATSLAKRIKNTTTDLASIRELKLRAG